MGSRVPVFPLALSVVGDVLTRSSDAGDQHDAHCDSSPTRTCGRSPRNRKWRTNMSGWSWFLTGVVAGTVATLAASALWPRAAGSVSRWPVGYSMTLGLVMVFALSALFLYSAVGTHTTSQGVTTRAPAAHPGTGAPNGNQAQSMDVATEALRTRLEQHGGTAADWQLLAQSYDFLGRPKDAEAARAHVTKSEETQWPDTQTVATLESASSSSHA
jgi:hypothetical protein